MSRNSRVFILVTVCLAAAAVIVAVRPVHGAKPSPPLSLKASFEEFWVEGENLNRIQNDVTGLPYLDTPDVKVGKKIVKSGVEIKYYFPSGYYTQGKLTMTIDQSGSLQRFVRLHFLEPSTDPAYENESHFPGLHVDPRRMVWCSQGPG